MAILETKSIHKSYVMGRSRLEVLKGIDLTVQEGSVVAIVGPSGVGKSTLLHILGALDRPDEGSIYVDGVDLMSLNEEDMAEFRNVRIGFVFQFHHLLPEFTALENTLMPALISGQSMKKSMPRAEELLVNVGLKERLKHRPAELSGGEQQRVAVARALMNSPRLVLADEPSGNLDRAGSESLHDLLFRLSDEFKQTFIIVTHNDRLADRAHRMIRMYDGRIQSDELRE